MSQTPDENRKIVEGIVAVRDEVERLLLTRAEQSEVPDLYPSLALSAATSAVVQGLGSLKATATKIEAEEWVRELLAIVRDEARKIGVVLVFNCRTVPDEAPPAAAPTRGR